MLNKTAGVVLASLRAHRIELSLSDTGITGEDVPFAKTHSKDARLTRRVGCTSSPHALRPLALPALSFSTHTSVPPAISLPNQLSMEHASIRKHDISQ
jgi:hypothetical protein